jgi:hypothetical protein
MKTINLKNRNDHKEYCSICNNEKYLTFTDKNNNKYTLCYKHYIEWFEQEKSKIGIIDWILLKQNQTKLNTKVKT